MKRQSDQELLRGWSQDRSEDSFRRLVDRYADLVFGTALRRTGDRQLAEEVSQNVFTVLAKKAGQLEGGDGIGGWLFKATVLEAASCQRSERRRDKRMRELQDLQEALRQAGGEAMAGDGMHLVDEGLASLGTSERNVLIARFFQGSSYAELAQTSGLSEAACRKQVSRALQKLAEALEGRGLRVSSTVLAAGLGAFLSIKAPAGLASSCATAAISATAAVGAPGLFATFFSAMSTSKITGVVVIGSVLFLVSTGSGFLIGREDAKKDGVVGGRESDPGVAAARPSKSEGPAASTRTVREGEGEEADRSRVEAIVNAMRKELRGKDWDVALQLGRPLAAGLRTDEMEEAFALIAGGEANLRVVIAAVLYGHWGKLDGSVAVEHAMSHEDAFVRRAGLVEVVRSWAKEDPQSAMAWQRKLAEQDDGPISEAKVAQLWGSLLRGWAERDMDAAWDEFETLDPDLQHAAINGLGDLIEQPEYREAMGSRMAKISDERLRSKVAEEVGEDWARSDPSEAAEWFGTVEFTDPMLRMRAAMEIGEQWFDTDPRAAATWLWPMVPEDMHARFLQEMVGSPWASGDQAGLQAWLKERGYSLDELLKKGQP